MKEYSSEFSNIFDDLDPFLGSVADRFAHGWLLAPRQPVIVNVVVTETPKISRHTLF